jgi:hypothetical protein
VTLAFGNYEESYPPEILRGYAPPLVAGVAARSATPDEEEEAEVTDPTTPPPDPGPESNTPEGAVPVDSTRTDPDGPAVVAVPADQLDEAAVEAEPTPTVRAASAREVEADQLVGEQLAEQPNADTVLEGTNTGPDGSETTPAKPRLGSSDDALDDEPEQLENTGTEFTVSAGNPGTYEPAVSASERPRNVTELRARARPATPEPWDEGAYVLVGTTGKRAHWTGDDWHGDESPGYGEGDDE